MNMLVNHITRFIRRRLVLGIVFVFSLTYCIYSFSKDLSFTDSYAVKKMETAASNVNRKLFAWNSNTTTENLHSDLLFCRNSVQGKYLITDDQGYVCKRAKILSSGCCDSNSSFTKRYSCNTCKDEGCCNIYEYCVSCCMHPKQRPLLESTMSTDHSNFKIILSAVGDQFELCVARCRTNSRSVYHENTYRNPVTKFCFGMLT